MMFPLCLRAGIVCLVVGWVAGSGAAAGERPAWVKRSDENAQIVTELLAKYQPEFAGLLGVAGVDEAIVQLPLDLNARVRRDDEQALALLRRREAEETHRAVRQDLAILIDLLARDVEEVELEERLLVPYFNLPEMIFRGLRALLDEQVAAERRAAAVVRLRRYAGLEEGYTPLAEQAEALIRSRFDEPGLLGPYRGEVERDLALGPRVVDGIGKLFAEYALTGYEEAYASLRTQLAAYEEFLREEVLPRARDDFRLPPELYALELRNLGVDLPVAELASRGKVAFKEIQNEMRTLAALVAEERGLPSADYRDVIRELKKEQLVGEEILEHYTARIGEVEALIARERVVTLPQRKMRLRLASEAESAVVRAATIRWPQLLGEAAEVGEIILPLNYPGAEAAGGLSYDDFTHESASWSLVVHEGRPGHELQMASILERGVSKARGLFALNSVNVEGWALYAEAEMKPYLPLAGQLVSLQYRLLRAARAFLDPGLQSGEVTPEEALRILSEEVVVGAAVAEQEVERYTSDSPGQATSYFCGYSRLMELRTDAERILGPAFDRQAFNDFVLGQGLLPPSLLRQAVLEEFVRAGR